MKRSSTFLIGIFLLVTTMLASPVAGQVCVEPPPGLVSWWPGDGNASDIISSLDGTLVNGTVFAPGFVAEAFSLDGNDNYVDLPFEAMNGLADFTVDMWVNLTLDDTGALISGAGLSPGTINEFILFPNGNLGNFIVFVHQGTGGHSFSVFIHDGMWHHVAFAREGSTGRLYVDGALIDSRAVFAGALVISPGGLLLGQEQDSVGGGFNPAQAPEVLIDELGVFDRALEASEIQAIFAAGSAGKCKAPDVPSFSLLGMILLGGCLLATAACRRRPCAPRLRRHRDCGWAKALDLARATHFNRWRFWWPRATEFGA